MRRARRKQQTMRMECRRRHRLTSIPQEARVRLPRAHRTAIIDIEQLDLVALRADREHRRMFVDRKRFEIIRSGLDGLDRLVHANVPEFDFAVAAAADEFALAAALEVHVCDPLLVFFPDFDHGCCGLLALVVDADGAVAEAGDEDIAFDLIRGQRCDARAGARRYVL
jgi:hypothetical protein